MSRARADTTGAQRSFSKQLRLVRCASEQRRAQPRALEHERHGGAERAGADNGGPARMLARGADAGTFAQVTW
jgi:hypothetical protein